MGLSWGEAGIRAPGGDLGGASVRVGDLSADRGCGRARSGVRRHYTEGVLGHWVIVIGRFWYFTLFRLLAD